MAENVLKASQLPVGSKKPKNLVSAGSGDGWWQNLSASASATRKIADVEAVWLQLEKSGIESPGQSLDFTKAWIARFDVPVEEQLYVTGEAHGKVVALLPLRLVKRAGARVLTWFGGTHVGCNAPLIDHDAFEKLSARECDHVWHEMRRVMIGADLVCLHAIPAIAGGNYFSGLGHSIEVETLYRSEFDDWEHCQKVQRTRSRKKHDKQQGAKLGAMGEVSFEELGPGDDVEEAMEILFAQKAIRFAFLGIDNPFADKEVRDFYRDIFLGGSTLLGRLHVLRLNGEIIAVRYNLAHENRMFALISSMSERSKLRPGSPGKQNILRAMQTIFEADYKVCDMGSGYSDEKRQWCNVTIPLKTHYIDLNSRGAMVAKMHRFKYRGRKFIKENQRLFDMFKSARSVTRKNTESKSRHA